MDYIEPSPDELYSVMLHFKINIANNVDPSLVPNTLLEEILASEGTFVNSSIAMTSPWYNRICFF